MVNIILIILGFFLTRKKEEGKAGTGESSSGERSSATNNLIIGGFVVIGYLIFKSAWDKQKAQNTFNDVASNPNVGIALAIHTAFNPSGTSVLGGFDGTDTDALFAIAPTISKAAWPDVQNQYQNAYTENLVQRLTSELSNEDFTRFISLIGSGGTTIVPGTKSPTTTTPVQNDGKGNLYDVVVNGKKLPVIFGKMVKVLSGKRITFKDTGDSFTGGAVLGTALGWRKVGNVISVVYEYKPYWYSLKQERTVDANSVQTI